MAQFYKELKELRISKEISLEDLQNKTKINIRYLEAIESGNFEVLPTPYLRLFIRAYALEIGGDADRALEQLDSFVGGPNKPIKSSIKPNEKEDNNYNNEFNFFSLLSDSNLKLRKDIFKVSILSILFIFSILIIKKIFSNEVTKLEENSFSVENNQIKIISDEDLLKNYTEDKFIEKSLMTVPPFFFSINADSEIGILVEQDTLKPYTKFLYPGTEVNLEGFISSAKLIFTNTNKIKARLNGEDLSLIENYPHPLKVHIRSSPPSISVKLFTPLN